MGQSNYVHLEDCTILRATEKALLVRFDGEEDWFPRSQIEGGGESLDAGDDGVTVTITEWFARQRGIEGE